MNWTISISLLFLLLMGVPVAISLGTTSLLALVFHTSIPTIIITQRLLGGVNSFLILAIPFFIWAGNVMTEGGVSEKLVNLAHRFVGRLTGGLAMVSTLAAMFFGAISGSSAATTAAVGSIMVPQMSQKGYSKDFAAATVAASGLLGLLIPPSGTAILYAVIADVSILELFLGVIGPGILIGFSFMLLEYILCKRNGLQNLEESYNPNTSGLRGSFWALMSPVIVIGGIYSGLFTPTEASAVSVLYAIVIGFVVYRSLSWKRFYEATLQTANSSAVVLFMIATASVFAWVMATQQIPQDVAKLITGISNNPKVVLLLINVFLLIVGCFLDNVAAILLVTPVLLPVIKLVGIDPVFFGIIMVVNLAIGQVTPPVGMNLFVASNISGVPLARLSRRAVPFVVVAIADLMLISYVPAIATFIPNLLLH